MDPGLQWATYWKLSLEIPSAAALLDVVYLPELVHIASGTWYRVSGLNRELLFPPSQKREQETSCIHFKWTTDSFTVSIQRCDNSPFLNQDIESEGTSTIASSSRVDLLPDGEDFQQELQWECLHLESLAASRSLWVTCLYCLPPILAVLPESVLQNIPECRFHSLTVCFLVNWPSTTVNLS